MRCLRHPRWAVCFGAALTLAIAFADTAAAFPQAAGRLAGAEAVPPHAGVVQATGMSPEEWLDTIRVPLRGIGRADCVGVGPVEFEAGKAEVTDLGRRNLDALATALTSGELNASRYEVLWLPGSAKADSLTKRRIAFITDNLRSRPTLTAARLSVASTPAARFDGCPRPQSADTILLKIRPLAEAGQ